MERKLGAQNCMEIATLAPITAAINRVPCQENAQDKILQSRKKDSSRLMSGFSMSDLRISLEHGLASYQNISISWQYSIAASDETHRFRGERRIITEKTTLLPHTPSLPRSRTMKTS